MSDETGPIEPEAGAPVPPPAGYPAYAVPQGPAQPRPRFADQVMGMRAVVATALACLVVGGLGGFVLGHATGQDDRMMRGPGFFQQRGAFPNLPNGFQRGPMYGGTPQRRFDGTPPSQGSAPFNAPSAPPSTGSGKNGQ